MSSIKRGWLKMWADGWADGCDSVPLCGGFRSAGALRCRWRLSNDHAFSRHSTLLYLSILDPSLAIRTVGLAWLGSCLTHGRSRAAG